MIKRFYPGLSSLLVLSVVSVSGCTTSTQFVDYKQERLYSGETLGGMNYVEIGPAVGRARGYIWESCEQIQQEALKELQNETREHGANTVFDVRWVNHAEGSLDETPLCTTRWGWFAGFGVAGLAPWVKVTEVRGKLAYADASTQDELRTAADEHQAKLNEQAQQDSAEEASEADDSDRDKGGEGPASDAEGDNSENAGEDATEESAVVDEAEASDNDTEQSSETMDAETTEPSVESDSDVEAEADDDAQDENGQDDNSNADEQSSSS